MPEGCPSHTNESSAFNRLGFKLRISLSHSGNRFLIFPMSHSLDSGLRSSETSMFALSFVGGPIGWSGLERNTHGSLQNLVERPLPMTLPKLILSISFPIIIPLHSWDDELGVVLSMKEDFVQYLPLSMRESKQSGFVSIL